MEQKDYAKAKEIFYRCRGSFMAMYSDGELEHFRTYNVPRALVRTWLTDMRTQAFNTLQSATEQGQKTEAFRAYGEMVERTYDAKGLYAMIEWIEHGAASLDVETMLSTVHITMRVACSFDAREQSRVKFFRDDLPTKKNLICKTRFRLRGTPCIPPRHKDIQKATLLRYTLIAAKRLRAVLQQLDTTDAPHRVAKELNDTIKLYQSMRYACPMEFRL